MTSGGERVQERARGTHAKGHAVDQEHQEVHNRAGRKKHRMKSEEPGKRWR